MLCLTASFLNLSCDGCGYGRLGRRLSQVGLFFNESLAGNLARICPMLHAHHTIKFACFLFIEYEGGCDLAPFVRIGLQPPMMTSHMHM